MIVSLIVASAIGGWRWFSVAHPSIAKLRLQSEQAETSGDFAQSEILAEQFLAREPNDPVMLLRAIRVAVKQNHLRQAGEYLARFTDLTQQEDPAVNSPIDRSTMSVAGEAFFQAGYVDLAETCFRRVLRSNQSEFQSAQTRMAFLLSGEGRRWESVPYLFEQLKHGQVSIDQLLWLANLQAIVGDDELLKPWAAVEPDGLGLQLATAIRKLAQQDFIDAAQRLIPLIEAYPECIEVGIQLGKTVLELSQLSESSEKLQELRERATNAFLRWHASGERINLATHPDLWVVRGRWFLTRRNARAAIRCFAEALRLNPDQQYANYQLAQLLQHDSQQSVSQECVKRAGKLSELFRITNLIYDNRQHIDLLRQAAEQTESLGRLWEAWGWYRMVLSIRPQSEWAWQNSTRLRNRLDTEQPERVLRAENPIEGLDLGPYPLPDVQQLSEFTSNRSSPDPSDTSLIRFEDQTRAAQLDFTYFNSPNDGSGKRPFEFTGGGIAVMDFDADGWPDLYFTQGSRLLEQAGRQSPQVLLDRLYRNIEGERFVDVTAVCGIAEDRFSQGVTVGDYDADGFPDLYVANIGPNQFFRNNGDGTFHEVAIETGTAGDSWSTSCVLADINGDGLSDLYVVNYLTGDDVLTRVCQDSDGRPRLCYPQVFQAAADQFYVNRGDGTFEESTEKSGIRDSTGRGLGIVAADFEGNGRLNLFIANDTTANFYFRNCTSLTGERHLLSEEGISSGLAFDSSGQALASMGIATTDVDRDGRLDLYVTNFERENNNLYRQTVAGLFTDSIEISGIRESSYLMLGFGTQFLDADLDGWSDLLVANGHIDNFSRDGAAYQMPPQFFRHRESGTFRELPAAELGRYFQRKYLGRAVARLDWNRDGLEEVAIGHLDEPSVLLTNRTQTVGRFLALEFRGVTSNRDAIGTRVELRIGLQTQHAQLVAGDGYQASNERRLIVGVGAVKTIDQVTVIWPNGGRQSFNDLPTNTEWTFVEGRNHPIRQIIAR